MSYENCENALKTLIEGVDGYSGSNVSLGDYRVLGQGKVGQQIASLKEDFEVVEKTLRNNMSGACSVGKRVDRLEKQMDHFSDR